MESESVKTKPETYIFNGFFGFVLFGPFRSCFSDCLAFLEEDDIGNKADGNNMPSRCAARELANEQATKQIKKEKQESVADDLEVEARRANAIADFASAHRLNASAKMMDASAKKMDASARILEKRLDLANNEKNQAYEIWKNATAGECNAYNPANPFWKDYLTAKKGC